LDVDIHPFESLDVVDGIHLYESFVGGVGVHQVDVDIPLEDAEEGSHVVDYIGDSFLPMIYGVLFVAVLKFPHVVSKNYRVPHLLVL